MPELEDGVQHRWRIVVGAEAVDGAGANRARDIEVAGERAAAEDIGGAAEHIEAERTGGVGSGERDRKFADVDAGGMHLADLLWRIVVV